MRFTDYEKESELRDAKGKKIKALINKIKHQVPDSPQAKFMFAIVETAILDLIDKKRFVRDSAIKYLNGDMHHLQVIGLEPSYVRRVLNKGGFTEVNLK